MSAPLTTGSDVVVIGGGVIGTSVAYHLALDGVGVMLIEANQIASGTSSMNAGAISLATKAPGLALKLAQLSLPRYESFGHELDTDVEYERCGVMVAAETTNEVRYLRALVRRQRAAGVDVEVLNGRELRRLNPLLVPQIPGGSYRADDAQVNPSTLAHGFATAARRRGASFLEGARVTSITVRNGRVHGVVAGGKPISASWIVNCGGYLAGRIGAMVGIDHVVVPRVGHQTVFAAPATSLPSTKLVTASQLLAKRRPEAGRRNVFFSYTSKPRTGQAIVGISNVPLNRPWWPWTEAHGRDPEREPTREILKLVNQWMPSLSALPFVGTYAAVRPHSPSGPVIGAMGPAGYVAAIGHGGDGVSLAAVTGEIVSSIVRGACRDAAEFVKQAPLMGEARSWA